MQTVIFSHTVSHNGKFYLRGKQVTLDDDALRHLFGHYEVVESEKEAKKPAKKKAKTAAILKPKKTAVVESEAE